MHTHLLRTEAACAVGLGTSLVISELIGEGAGICLVWFLRQGASLAPGVGLQPRMAVVIPTCMLGALWWVLWLAGVTRWRTFHVGCELWPDFAGCLFD